MSRRGDDRLTWDEQKVLEGNPEAIAAVREAERIFRKSAERVQQPFLLKQGNPHSVLTSLTPPRLDR